jgi:hypothetical protein
MKFTRFYIASLILSAILTLTALVTLLPAFGILDASLYAPVSTVALLGLVWINCMIRAEMKRKQFGG